VVFALPVLPWVAFNLYEYQWFWPISTGPAAAPASRNTALLEHVVELVYSAAFAVYGSLWLYIWPVLATDLRAPAVIAFAGLAALIVGLYSGELLRERRRLAFWIAAALVSFASAFVVLLANAVSVGGSPDFVARYFVAYACAYAAIVGTAVASMASSRPWLVRGSACALALVLFWQLLDTAYPSWVG
jgi:hypothetical protein